MIKKRSSNYRWYILGLTMATYAIIAGASRLCMPVLFKQISDDLHLSMVAIGTVWGMDPLAGVFFGLPSGLLADRFGVKRTLTILCIMAGIFGALRGFSINFLTMAATMFLFGIMAAAAPTIVPKVTAEWFSGKRLGLANAILNAGWSVGAMGATMFSATVLSPWLGSWRYVMFFYAVPAVALGLLWLFTAKDKSGTTETPAAEKIPFKQAISHVVHVKNIWIIGFVTFCMWGANMGAMGYLPTYLRNIGWTPTSADSAITVLSAITLIGSVPMVLLSDRLNTRKGIMLVSVVALAGGFFLIPFVNTLGIWLIIIIGGFLRSGTGALFNVMIFETEGIGHTYGGTAIGLANTIGMAGAVISPPIGNSLVSISYGTPYILWACMGAVAIPLLLLIKRKPARSKSLA